MAHSVTYKRKRSTSIRLSAAGDVLWETLANNLGISKQAVIEIAVRKLAAAEGIAIDRSLTESFSQAGDEAFAKIWNTPEEDEAWANL
jgi:hypothetical protein